MELEGSEGMNWASMYSIRFFLVMLIRNTGIVTRVLRD